MRLLGQMMLLVTCGFFLDDDIAPDDRVRADDGAGFDLRAVVDEAGRDQAGAVFDARLGRRRSARVRSALGEQAASEPAVEHVAVHLDVLLRRSDVDPVARDRRSAKNGSLRSTREGK